MKKLREERVQLTILRKRIFNRKYLEGEDAQLKCLRGEHVHLRILRKRIFS